MTLYIKNMVCVRCKIAVRSVLNGLGIAYSSVELGRAELSGTLTAVNYRAIQDGLAFYELELTHDRKMMLTERIKNLIIKMVYTDDVAPLPKFTTAIGEAMHLNYTSLSAIFTTLEDMPIEKFYILTRIQRVKELIIYENKGLQEISHLLNYSSEAYLCNQFKKVTGQLPSEFKLLFYPIAA